MSNKSKATGRALPVKWENVIEAQFVFRPTKMERLKILLGFNVSIKTETWTQHDAGKRQHFIVHRVINRL